MKLKSIAAMLLAGTTVASVWPLGRIHAEDQPGIPAGVTKMQYEAIPEPVPEDAEPEIEIFEPEVDAPDTWIGEDVVQICEDAGRTFQVSPELLEAIIEHESSGQQYAQNGSCIGLMQIDWHYHTGRMYRLGFDSLWDKRANVYTGASLLVDLCEHYGDIGAALMAYNGTSEWWKRTELTPYAQGVLDRAWELERLHGK